jgi:hypothetical protein
MPFGMSTGSIGSRKEDRMSVGVWNENSSADELDQLQNAVKVGRKALQAEKERRSSVIAELTKLADSVFVGKPARVKGRGGSRQPGTVGKTGLYPHRGGATKRRFRVLYFDSDTHHVEYSPKRTYQSNWGICPVRRVKETGSMMFDPEALYCFKETIREKTNITDERYIMELATLYFQED